MVNGEICAFDYGRSVIQRKFLIWRILKPNLFTMFLNLSHHKLDVYQFSENITLECYRVTRLFPADEKYSMVQQIRRAATSVFLNLNEGCSRKSQNERNRFFEIARGSLIEVDSAIGIACKLNFVNEDEIRQLGSLLLSTFKLFTKLIQSNEK